jgi:glycosyltransferase involved in cell wall biosynthesis
MQRKMKRKLRIAQIAPLWFPIPPKKYGGIERIISFLTEELVRRGHKVTLFASKSSKTKAELIPVSERGTISLGIGWHDYWWNLFCHSRAFERAANFDIVHCHWGIMGGFFQKIVKTPVLHTMHNIPIFLDSRWKIFKHYKNDLNLVFISKSEKRNAPVRFKNNWVVYNGIDVSQFKFSSKPKEHFIWIARICDAKGTKEAIEIAKKAKVKLLLAGQLQPHHGEYFEKEIKPELNSQIKYIGEISQEKLSGFYGQALACLYPIKWEEPFGLVMAESMACGTPVIAFDRGSAKEVVKDGKTGFVVKDIKEAIEAIKKISQIDRMNCRKRVENFFSYQRMVSDYEKVYQEILSRKEIK